MRVYLVRHGDAKPKQEDPDRHLSDTGFAQVRAMADFLRPLGLKVGAIWHSTKVRAGETAACLAAGVQADDGCVERDDLAPKDAVDPVARAIRKSDRDNCSPGTSRRWASAFPRPASCAWSTTPSTAGGWRGWSRRNW